MSNIRTKSRSIRPSIGQPISTFLDPKYGSKNTLTSFPTKLSNAPENSIYSIEHLKSNLIDLAKPNLFTVSFDIGVLPSVITEEELRTAEMFVKTATFPSVEVNKITIQRAGTSIKVPGDCSYGDVSITFFADVNHIVRQMFHKWHMYYINNYVDAIGSRLTSSIKNSKVRIVQIDPSFNQVYGIELQMAWPSSIGEIQMSHDNEHTREEFTVSFAYTYFKVLGV